MKKKFLLILAASLLTACAPKEMKLVDTHDAASFTAMSRAMRPVMIEKGIVDADGSWYSPRFAGGTDEAGSILLNRMSTAFCASELRCPSDSTFYEELWPTDRVLVSATKATIRTSSHNIELQLAAETDWNGDAKKDWLAVCRISRRDTPGFMREYFLLVSDLTPKVLHPHVLMVRDHFFKRAVVRTDNSAAEFVDTVTVEMEQGQKDVTQAPTAVQSTFGSSKVSSSSLSN